VVSPDPVIHRSSRLMGQRELQQHLPTSSPHQLHRSVYQSMHNGPIYDNVKPSPGAPAPISQTTWSQPDLQRSSDVFVPLNLPRRRVSPSPVSPAQPGPPPNTPLPPIPAASAYDAKHRASRSFLAAATLPSPTSPEARTRSLTFQQPRSVPLARLIQRRLSSVPEEDLSSVAERARSPPSSPQSKLNLSQSQSQRHLPTRPSFHAPGAPSPSATALSPQTETGDELNLGAPTAETDTATRITLQATVKLPHKPGGGKYAQGRASYRQKTSSKDGYSRGGDIKENLAATKGEDTRVAAAPKRKLRGRKVKASAATPAIVNETIKV
jgi:hypothetical protein